jgi:hypothetical protein
MKLSNELFRGTRNAPARSLSALHVSSYLDAAEEQRCARTLVLTVPCRHSRSSDFYTSMSQVITLREEVLTIPCILIHFLWSRDKSYPFLKKFFS